MLCKVKSKVLASIEKEKYALLDWTRRQSSKEFYIELITDFVPNKHKQIKIVPSF